MNIDWRSDWGQGVGDTFGYAVHDRKTREACVAAGVVIDDQADVAVTVCPPHSFTPAPGKFNVLFTAWENPKLADVQIERSRAADLICVPATFLVKSFREVARPGCPVAHVPLGVDPVFAWVDRRSGKRRPWTGGKPFRFLWVGAPNNRKGAEQVLEAFRLFTEGPRATDFARKVELYVKTSGQRSNGVTKVGQITFDDRRVPVEELARLYQSAHCFVFPTLGEGFGLTAAEAARTGCPVVYPPHTSMVDLFDPTCGFPLVVDRQSNRWSWSDCDGRGTPMAVDVVMEVPSTKSVAEQMLRVFLNPPAAFERGLIAAERMTRFTWSRCADALTSAIQSSYLRPHSAGHVNGVERDGEEIGEGRSTGTAVG